MLRTEHICEGYGAGMVDANEDGHAAHHAGPLPLELVRLTEATVDAGVQQAHDSWENNTVLEHAGSQGKDLNAPIINTLLKSVLFLEKCTSYNTTSEDGFCISVFLEYKQKDHTVLRN